MTARATNSAEAMVSWTIRATWPFYAIGALYVVGPVFAWLLAGLAFISLYLGPAMRPDLRPMGPIPPVVWGWVGGMLVMLVALWIGHLDWSLAAATTIKSSIGWAKGWALMALFPLAGAVLPIRRAPIVRAQCVVGLWTLCLLPILLAAPHVGLPSVLFVSPLKMVGGPGPEYFTLFLYIPDPATMTPRWSFYAPWCPFAGLLGVVMVLFALEEKDWRWMGVGILAGVAMILLSKSRMSLVALVVCSVGPRMMPMLLRAWAWGLASIAITSLAALGVPLLNLFTGAVERFKNARADSTRVRETLQRINEERWRTEAVWFGHGTVEPGPHLVEYMPIGSHHTWFGLLFVKGLVGLFALVVPLVWQLWLALVDAARSTRGRLPLGIMLIFVILSFGENIEIEVYMLWPALVILGIHARELRDNTFED
ncbi:MAG: O-antigen ligase domain-containing protein [Pseudomonadota bacterium]